MARWRNNSSQAAWAEQIKFWTMKAHAYCCFRNANGQERGAHRGPGAFTHTNGRYAAGFNQSDSNAFFARVKLRSDAGSCQPTGRTATHNHNMF